jgi:hypothetical protein
MLTLYSSKKVRGLDSAFALHLRLGNGRIHANTPVTYSIVRVLYIKRNRRPANARQTATMRNIGSNIEHASVMLIGLVAEVGKEKTACLISIAQNRDNLYIL